MLPDKHEFNDKNYFARQKRRIFFESYIQVTVFEFGPFDVDETEVLEFARRYDPQPFHIDHEAATKKVRTKELSQADGRLVHL